VLYNISTCRDVVDLLQMANLLWIFVVQHFDLLWICCTAVVQQIHNRSNKWSLSYKLLGSCAFRATVLDYLRAHDEKMLAKMGLDANHKSMLNPWAGDDRHPNSMVNPRVGCDGAVVSQPATLMKSAATTSSHRGGGGQILIYLLRLRQCCGHLSILRDVSSV